jgi:hypothetical protein
VATKKRASAAPKVKKSATKAAPSPALTPFSMTQEEVAAMSAGGAAAKAVAKRLNAHSPGGGSVKRKDNEPQSPASISATEMAALKKSKASSKTLRERMEKAAKSDLPGPPRKREQKPEPYEPPPHKS